MKKIVAMGPVGQWLVTGELEGWSLLMRFWCLGGEVPQRAHGPVSPWAWSVDAALAADLVDQSWWACGPKVCFCFSLTALGLSFSI